EEVMKLMPRSNTLEQTTALQPRSSSGGFLVAPVLALGGLLVFGQAGPAAKHGKDKNQEQEIEFNMVRSAALQPFVKCVRFARGEVEVKSKRTVEEMWVEVVWRTPNARLDVVTSQ